MLYNKDALRFSPKAEVDILPAGRWFGEEFFTYIRVFGSISSPHVLPLYVPDKLLAREIAYQTCEVGGMSKELKDKKKVVLSQYPVVCGAFSLFDLGHAFKEVDNMLSLRLFKFPGRQFDLFDVIKKFTTAIKIKVFTKEDDLFDDIFQQKSTLKDILHMAQIQFVPMEFQEFKLYRERRLANIPLDKLCLEPIRERTTSIDISGSSRTDKS